MQVDIHAPWGGVVPKLAQEAHERAMDSTVEAALQEAGISQEQLEGVAVTIGPGLSLCLQVANPCQQIAEWLLCFFSTAAQAKELHSAVTSVPAYFGL